MYNKFNFRLKFEFWHESPDLEIKHELGTISFNSKIKHYTKKCIFKIKHLFWNKTKKYFEIQHFILIGVNLIDQRGAIYN